MIITVKLFATLRQYNEKIFTLKIEEGAKILDVIESIKVPADEVSIIMVNGRGKEMDDILNPNDVLALFPPVGGG